MQLHKNQIIPLEITSIANDGSGVGRYEGKAVFVTAAALGDTLRVKITKDSKRLAYGRIEQVVTPGPGRQKEDCPISRSCGGCCFRHLQYEAELAAKQGFVADALQRIGKLDVPVLPILPSPLTSQYRNKVQYPVGNGKNNELIYGFYASRSHRIVQCDNCLLQPPILNRIARRCVSLLGELGVSAYDEAAHTGFLRHIYLRRSWQTGEILLCFVATASYFPHKEQVVEALRAEFPEISSVVLNVNPQKTNVVLGKESIVLSGSGILQDTLAGVPLQLDIFSFSQVNTPGAERLFSVVKEYAAVTPADTVLDLYCGAGVIGLSLAQHCKELIGVEIIPQAIENARESARQMALCNTRFIAQDASAAAAQLAQEGTRPNVAIVDPPRKGCDEATLGAILHMQPGRIVMVSCNPATLARDAAFLCENGYEILQVQPVDMFPRTHHVESVVLLSRKSPVAT